MLPAFGAFCLPGRPEKTLPERLPSRLAYVDAPRRPEYSYAVAELPVVFKAARELGVRRMLTLLRYRIGIRSGWYRLRVRPPAPVPDLAFRPLPFLKPGGEGLLPPSQTSIDALLSGKIEIFGGVAARLDFSAQSPLGHWTAYETPVYNGRDIKFAWEPARFCWAADLVRAHLHTGDPRLPAFFRTQLEAFNRNHPAYSGPHWANGQEVALRLLHLALAGSLLPDVPGLAQMIAVHAARIPPTLTYARAQFNNHLLSEAAALVTAAACLPEHPAARRWLRAGWNAFHEGVSGQFAEDGAYVQHSTNYHRLALQLGLWVFALTGAVGQAFPDASRARLAAGTRWLLQRCDPQTGAVPNLGPNDGAYLFPLTGLPFFDFRPVAQAAAVAFLGAPAFEPGPWDEFAGWLGLGAPQAAPVSDFHNPPPASGILTHPQLDSRAALRAVRFTHRPGHADQLHVDLWWRGEPLALDPGTYLYNADPPWDNALQSAFHHNTLTADGRDQMTRAGRFLYVDRAQGRLVPASGEKAAAEHDGYRRLGITHHRTLAAGDAGWRITDRVEGSGRHELRVHWLLPDWPWELDETTLVVHGPAGTARLRFHHPEDGAARIQLARAGESLAGDPVSPTAGWVSPTYAVRKPALSFSLIWAGELPVAIESGWTLARR